MDIKMIDLPLIINPLYHMEILTLSEDYKTILYGTVFDPVNNPQSFPTNFVGRIYTNGNSIGTGFVYLKNGTIYIISAKHVQEDPFSSNSKFFICFDNDQHSQNLIDIFDDFNAGIHACPCNLYEITPCALNVELYTNQTDPITGELYSIDNDFCAFNIFDRCICGNSYCFPTFTFLDVSAPPSVNTEVFLFGFPGKNFKQERVLPQAPEFTNDLAAEARKKFSSNKLS